MRTRKRRYDGHQGDADWILNVLQPARKKTKAEVMAEVIAKSKEHKVRLDALHNYHIKHRSI